MLISGLQKMSLVDFPGKVACTLFTGGCNLRCPFCHNSELLNAPPAAMTEEAFFSFLKKREGLLDGVCVSGGEPCLQKDLPDFLRKLRQMPFAVKLDTNGLFPAVLRQILEEKLVDYVAMDLKNSPDRFAETVGLFEMLNLKNAAPSDASTLADAAPSDSSTGEDVYQKAEPLLAKYRESLACLFVANTPFELRTTVVAQFHDAAAFEGIRDFLLPFARTYGRKAPAYYLQPFTDRETVPFAGLTAPPKEEVEAFAKILTSVAETVGIRGISS